MRKITQLLTIILFNALLLTAGTNYHIRHTGNATGKNINGEEKFVLTASSGGKIQNVKFKRLHFKSYDIKNNQQTIEGFNFTYSHTPDNTTQTTDSYGNIITEATFNPERTEVWMTANFTGQTDINIPGFKPSDVYPLDTSTLPSSITQFLEATTKIQSDNSTIKSKAENIASGCTTEQDAVEKLTEWIIGNINYYHDENYNQDAINVYNNKKGNCEGYTNLMIAFLRSIGIPSRFHCGIILNKAFTVPLWEGNIWEVGTSGPGTHATYQVYYPSISNWVAGDPQGYVNYINTNNLILGHGKDMNDCVESYSCSYSGNIPSFEQKINSTIASIDPCSYEYHEYSTFGGTRDGLGLLSVLKEENNVGIEDYVYITQAPDYLEQNSTGNIVRAQACDVEPYGNISDLSTCELYARSIEGDVMLSDCCTMYDFINGYWEFEMVVPFLSGWNNTWIRDSEENNYIQAYFKVINGAISSVSSVLILSPPTTSGTISKNESWAGTHTLTGDVTIPNGVVLYILPGTSILFPANTSIICESGGRIDTR